MFRKKKTVRIFTKTGNTYSGVLMHRGTYRGTFFVLANASMIDADRSVPMDGLFSIPTDNVEGFLDMKVVEN